VPEIIEEIEDVVELDPEEALAERRRKRAEIMAKHSAAPSSASSARGTPAPMEVAAIKVEKFSGGVSAGGSSPGEIFFSPSKRRPYVLMLTISLYISF
jgi:hypothetical protein